MQQAHLVAHQEEVLAQCIVLQHVLQYVQVLKWGKRQTQNTRTLDDQVSKWEMY